LQIKDSLLLDEDDILEAFVSHDGPFGQEEDSFITTPPLLTLFS
jgi:hypothetical protein